MRFETTAGILWGSQKGTKSTRLGSKVAQPWINLLRCGHDMSSDYVCSRHNNLPEFWNSFDQMRLDKIRHPFRRLLTKLSLEFDLQNAVPVGLCHSSTSLKNQEISVLEKLLIIKGNLIEREINPDVRAAPIVA